MMKLIVNLLTLTCSIFLSNAAFAGWEKTGRSDSFAIYVDISSISRSGSIASMRVLFDNDRVEIVSGREVRSSITGYEYDCQSKSYRSIRYGLYGGQMGSGQALIDISKVQPWRATEIGGSQEFNWKIACGLLIKN